MNGTVCLALGAAVLLIGVYYFPTLADFLTTTAVHTVLDKPLTSTNDIYDLTNVLQQNSETLPQRTNNKTAEKLCETSRKCAPKLRYYETAIRVGLVVCFPEDQLCKDKNEFTSTGKWRAAYDVKPENGEWSLVMVAREPVGRFVSGYLDKCVRKPTGSRPCNGCGLNLTCFVEHEYERVMNISRRRKVRKTFEDSHFFPQIWHCDLASEFARYKVIEYSADPFSVLLPQFFQIAAGQNVPQSSIDFIKRQYEIRTMHSTTDTPAYNFYLNRLLGSPYLLEYIVKTFYYDFLSFGFPFPEGF